MKRFSLDDLLQMARPHVTVENAHCFALVLARIFDLDEKILLKAIEPPDELDEALRSGFVGTDAALEFFKSRQDK